MTEREKGAIAIATETTTVKENEIDAEDPAQGLAQGLDLTKGSSVRMVLVAGGRRLTLGQESLVGYRSLYLILQLLL